EALADRELQGLPARTPEIRGAGRRADRRTLARAHGRSATLGYRRRRGLERQVDNPVVRGAALLRVARVEGLQDAHPGALVEVPLLHALQGLQRRTAATRCAALAGRFVRAGGSSALGTWVAGLRA